MLAFAQHLYDQLPEEQRRITEQRLNAPGNRHILNYQKLPIQPSVPQISQEPIVVKHPSKENRPK